MNIPHAARAYTALGHFLGRRDRGSAAHAELFVEHWALATGARGCPPPSARRSYILHVNYCPYESPPIGKGSNIQKFWRYQRRLDRLDRLAEQMEQTKGRPLLMGESMTVGGLYAETLEHIEALGFELRERDDGEPYWVKDGRIYN